MFIHRQPVDSSHPQRISSSNPKREAQGSMMAKYHQQNFSIPDSVIYYIAKNPKTAALYLKMVKTCKYFFITKPILVFYFLDTFGGKWRVNVKPLDITKYDCEYWITDVIEVSASEFVDENILLPIIPKLYQCDSESLSLSDQIISFNDLSLIISSAEEIDLYYVDVKHSDSSDIPLEDIIATAINAKYVYVYRPTITPKTMKQLLQIPHFATLDHFGLYGLSEVFDVDAFYSYMKKNLHTEFYLDFDDQITDAFMNQLETIVDEILQTEQFNYKPPVIYFTGLDIQKYEKLRRICDSH
uniref:Uncharacterized protein n=1 Tax=Panagrolaimus davidi TaxID=227884 RepID=A0A914QEC7_9BILA